MYKVVGTIFLIFVTFACSSSRKIIPSRVGVLPLRNYKLNERVEIKDEVTFRFFTRPEDFHNNFYMTKSSRATAVVPDFNSQSVFAIILKPTEKVISVNAQKAEMEGKTLHIYYSVTDTVRWTTFTHIPMLVAMVPKVNNLQEVHFYNDNIKQKTLKVVE